MLTKAAFKEKLYTVYIVKRVILLQFKAFLFKKKKTAKLNFQRHYFSVT